MNNDLIFLLKDEVKPAMGCTEPVAVTLACAKARQIGDHTDIEKLEVKVSPNIFKNGLSVGIPKIDLVGIMPAAAIGGLTGDAALGLKIFESVEIDKIDMAKELVESGRVEVVIKDTDEKVYIEIIMTSKKGKTSVIISGMHHHISYISHNDIVIYESWLSVDKSKVEISSYSLDEILDYVTKAPEKAFEFLLEGLKMNGSIAKMGLEKKLGLGVGYHTKLAIRDGILGDDLANRAMYYTAGASDARMSGVSFPVMSSNGSGNNGLTAILPLYAYKEMKDVSDEKMSKALAMSHLINCYIKNEIGRLSALCSCGISAATGASSAITWLEGGSYMQVKGAIQNMIANLSGMICDGAKNSCALKLATAASTSVHSAVLSLYGSASYHREGIVGKTAEESIKNLGVLSKKGMQLTDATILEIMKTMV
jgi:L-cysteine desulfidase